MDKAAIRERVSPLLELVGLAALADRYPRRSAVGKAARGHCARAGQPSLVAQRRSHLGAGPGDDRSILDLLRQVNRELGLTVVLITHQMQVIKQVADRGP